MKHNVIEIVTNLTNFPFAKHFLFLPNFNLNYTDERGEKLIQIIEDLFGNVLQLDTRIYSWICYMMIEKYEHFKFSIPVPAD